MTLLQERDLARRQRRLELQADVRQRLRVALRELIPGCQVFVFGSLVRPGAFNDRSDIDLAFEVEPRQMGALALAGELMERLERPVDLVFLPKCRFREKILREGEKWII